MLTDPHRKPGLPGIHGFDLDGREVTIPEDATNPDYAALVAADMVPVAPPVDLVAYAADRRWRKEVGGITLGGVPVATDDRSKIMIMGARVAASADPEWSTVWHGADGSSHPLNAAAIIAISNAVEAHVNATFSTFAEVKAAIEAGEIVAANEVEAAFA